MIHFLLSQVASVHFLACPHFKLESVNSLYQQAQLVASSNSDQAAAGKLAPLVNGGDLTQTLANIT